MANNTVIASDGFHRANGPVGSNWVADGGSSGGVENISSNLVVPPATGTVYGQLWNSSVNVFPNDQISEIQIGTGAVQNAGNFIVLIVRGSSVANTSYNANLVNNTLQVFRTVTGVSTQLGSTVATTIQAGDVWALQAVGSFIIVYQNYVRRFYYFDSTITSGQPGFRVLATTAASAVPVSSWGGYSMVQQDGVWQKQGIVMPALAGDSGTTPANGIGLSNISKIFYDGSIYYCWGSGGPQSASAKIWYFTSPDGVTWTRGNSGNPVLTGLLTPAVVLDGGTYYMYVQPGTGPGSATFALYTSTDRINWSLVSSTILALGAGGQWDDEVLWAFNPIAQVAGTWYATYAAGADAATQSVSVGIATATNLAGPWTKYGGNPVITRAYCTQAVVQVGSTYYGWFSTSPVGRSTFALNPIEGVRYQSTDLLTWTNPTTSVHCSQIFEDVNGVVGQCYANAMIDIGGRAYQYTTSSISDSASPTLYQIGLAIAPASIAQIITQLEDAVRQVVSDGFTSGVGALPASWTKPTGGTALQIVSGNKAEPTTTSVWCQAVRTAESFGDDQYSEVTIAALGTSAFVSPLVRYSTSALSGYCCSLQGPTGSLVTGGVALIRQVAGAETVLGSTNYTPTVGDTFRLTVVGNVLSLYQRPAGVTGNGFLMLQIQDSTFTTGIPGFRCFATTAITDSQVSAWAGGNANISPSYSGGAGANNDMLNLTRWCTRLWG